MENKKVGYIIIGIAAILGAIIFLFNRTLNKIVSDSCSHGPTCPMYGNISTQTWISVILLALIIVIGVVLIFTKEKVIVKTKKIKDEFSEKMKEHKENNLKLLDKEEKIIYSLLLKDGSMFQSDLVEKSGFDKVKVTRILDRLEGKSLIERKRRGMTNIVILR